MTLRLSCRGPVLCLFSSLGVGPVPSFPCFAWGRATPCGRVSCCVLALALWGRHEGASGRRLSPGCVASGVGRSPVPDRPSFGAYGWGPLPTGVRALGLVINPTAHTLAGWLGALSGRHEGARGGRLLPRSGLSGVGRSPTSDRPSFGMCGRGPLPTGCRCGGCGMWGSVTTLQRALLRAGFLTLRLSCRGPVLCLFSSLGVGPVPSFPFFAWGRATPCGRVSCCVLALALWGRHEGS